MGQSIDHQVFPAIENWRIRQLITIMRRDTMNFAEPISKIVNDDFPGDLMENKKGSFQSIDEYIAAFPEETQRLLELIRTTIRASAPEAEEKISYQMPTFYFKGNLVHFAAWKYHIGFYPTPSGTLEFREKLSKYEGGKGSVKFPIDKPLPLELIREIVKFRVAENLLKAEKRSSKG
jgi:uncharacterized protein YdhG (YjbR/CyaY superfamily)